MTGLPVGSKLVVILWSSISFSSTLLLWFNNLQPLFNYSKVALLGDQWYPGPTEAPTVELSSRRRWMVISSQLSNKFSYCPTWNVSIVLIFHKHNSLQLGILPQAFISCYLSPSPLQHVAPSDKFVRKFSELLRKFTQPFALKLFRSSGPKYEAWMV